MRTYVDESGKTKLSSWRGKENEKKREKIITIGLDKFLNDDNNNFKYDFENEPREGDADNEASYLSNMIFIKIINMFKKNIDDETYIFKRADAGTDGSRYIHFDNGKIVAIGFDVMNNPNKPGRGMNNVLDQNFGSTNEIKELKNIYHRIGNYTFFPKSKNYDKKYEIQRTIHKSMFKEDWNKTLKYLEDNWDHYQFDVFCDFKEYIKMSLQQFYTKKGWGYLKDIILKDKEQYQKLTCDNKIYEKELRVIYNEIKNFDDEIYCDKYDNDHIIVINAIVKIRSKLIIMLLNGKIKP